MWYRLKSSLLTALVATVLVLSFMAVAEPAVEAVEPASPLYGLTGLSSEQERAAYQLAVTLTALTIDAAVDTAREAADKPEGARHETPSRRVLSAVRMPFYSFAAKAARRPEPGA
ncbi:hypothetical protein [Pseudomarimonas salicorniae]|uniref:Uncharacterized protein n=1 Tax=Pseudomarimonas salicorniae TaxID=2933270 RepID=A0ABT0GN01_9GAMM|nr:hypothetical protein [Lysobacter sp. CAU 1642]MCK7595377.1 hypothetical protein [Lysobacter sp. CAU 1642]